jgi:hypothetical protein
MNGWGYLFWLASIVAVFSLPLVFFVGLTPSCGRWLRSSGGAVPAADMGLVPERPTPGFSQRTRTAATFSFG